MSGLYSKRPLLFRKARKCRKSDIGLRYARARSVPFQTSFPVHGIASMLPAAALVGLFCVASALLFSAYILRQLGAADLAQVLIAVIVMGAFAALAGALLA